MSHDESTTAVRTGLSVLARACHRRAVARVRAVAFWFAVGLPWVVLAGILGGHVTSHPAGFAGLCTVTVACVFLGRDHRR
jgi:hypothetical protein